MTTEGHPTKPPEGAQTSLCAYIGSSCLLSDMGRLLGANIRDSLMDFIFSSEEGSRLSLQKTRDGFTVQVTGPVQRTSRDAADLARSPQDSI